MSAETSGRRRFLQSALAAGGALMAPGPVLSAPARARTSTDGMLPGGLDPRDFIVHSENPLALEVRRSRIGSGVITPVSRFFVRNNLPMPPGSIVEHPDSWVLSVEGVDREGSITLAELKGLGLETEAAVIQCSGNGRKFFTHSPSGSEWSTGAAGCALWTGIRLSRVIDYFGGALNQSRFVTSTGADPLPAGMDPDSIKVERTIPLDKALADALLVWEMNGEPVPLIHGGPLRLVVPGYYGVNSIKYVKRIRCTTEESSAKIHQTGYRMRAIGSSGSARQPSMWRMPVKSWVNGPGADNTPVLAGKVTFYGVAFSGERGIDRVEVSLDLGKNWHVARLVGPDLGVNAWRTFTYTTRLPAGEISIVSRATDTAGETQPRQRKENERGYGHNGWLDAVLPVRLSKSLPDPVATETSVRTPATSEDSGDVNEPREVVLSEAGQSGKQVFMEAAQPGCGACHTLADAGASGALGPDLDTLKPQFSAVEAAVSGGLGVMPAYDSTLTPEQIRNLSTYIVEATK